MRRPRPAAPLPPGQDEFQGAIGHRAAWHRPVDEGQHLRGCRRGYLAGPGGPNRQIARALVLSPDTVANCVGSAMRKLGVSSRTDLAARAVENGIVPGIRTG